MRNALVAALALSAAAAMTACYSPGDPNEPNEDVGGAEMPPSKDLASGTSSSDGMPSVDLAAALEAASLGAATPSDPNDDAEPTNPDGSDGDPSTPVDPGPGPSQACKVTKDGEGFFVRNSGKSDYVAYVPASYSPKAPMRVVVGLHGCGDTAINFARWGVNPLATRKTQNHIGISVGGETGKNRCWSIGGDDDKVLAAVDDLAKCFWVNRSKVVVAGFSSGGQLAYRVGMKRADRFAGILIENSSLYAADSKPDMLLTTAPRKLPIAHRAHSGDTVFPISKVKADWAKTKSAGFPLQSSEVAGPHDGNSQDWTDFLLPASSSWALR